MTDDLRARLNAALTAPHALDALERLFGEWAADLRAEIRALARHANAWKQGHDNAVLLVATWRGRAEAAEARVAALETTLAEVRALHHPDQSGEFCDHCWTGPDAHGNGASPWWPCATIRVLDADGADTTTGCGHPNHGATDHSCAPFTTDVDIFDDGGRTYPAILPTIDGSGR